MIIMSVVYNINNTTNNYTVIIISVFRSEWLNYRELGIMKESIFAALRPTVE